MNTHWVEAGGLHWRVRSWGRSDRPALVFLHGFTWDGASWEAIAASMDDHYCLAPDLPGHGDTSFPEVVSEWTFDRVVGALADLLRALGLERSGMVGYSQGGRLALALALAFPRLVGRLTLIGASAGLATESERRARKTSDEAQANDLLRDGMAPFLDRWMALPLFETMRSLPVDVLTALRVRRLTQRPEGLAAALRVLGTGSQPYLLDVMPSLQPATLLVVGEKDAKFRAIAGQLQAAASASQLEIIAGAGHAVPFERPDALVTLLKRFMTEAPRAASLR